MRYGSGPSAKFWNNGSLNTLLRPAILFRLHAGGKNLTSEVSLVGPGKNLVMNLTPTTRKSMTPTEEDTFRALKKASFETVDKATDVLWLNCNEDHHEYFRRVQPLLSGFGWTWEEWSTAYEQKFLYPFK